METAMVKNSIVRQFKFSAGHRLYGHLGKCRAFHGHNYILEVTLVRVGELDANGMVMDFGEVKSRFGKWIDDNWDHAMIVSTEDIVGAEMQKSIPDCKCFELYGNVTAEKMAEYFLVLVAPALLRDAENVRLTKVAIWETDGCKAVAEFVE
jgi:6-pyruvoyltetrahydropterin/6-carboxytetrahydropterin synthase